MACLLGAALTLSGCGHAREVNLVAYALGLAVDHADPEGLEVTVQLAVPASLQPGAEGKPVWHLSARGAGVFDAIRRMTARSGRPIAWGHLQVVVFGEDLARSGLAPHLDFFGRNREVRRSTAMAVAPGRAAEVLAAETHLERVPAMFIRRLIENRNLHGRAPEVTLNDFLVALAEPGQDPWAPRLALRGGPAEPQLELAGAAAFRHDRLVGWLREDEARGVLWATRKLRGGVLSVAGEGREAVAAFGPTRPAAGPGPVRGAQPAVGQRGRRHATLEVVRAGARRRIAWEGGRAVVALRLSLEANLVEDEGLRGGIERGSAPAGVAEIEREAEQVAAGEVRRAVERARQLGTDPFGFGSELRRQDPALFAALDWKAAMAAAEVDVSARVHVSRVGLTGAPPSRWPRSPRPASTFAPKSVDQEDADRRSSAIRAMSAVSNAASVPAPPTAMPTVAVR